MDKKLFAKLMESVNQMADHAAGKKVKGVREVVLEIKTPKPLSAEEIISIRKKLRASQKSFAALLNVSPKTVQKWEQGENHPNGSSLKLLTIAKKNPEMLFLS